MSGFGVRADVIRPMRSQCSLFRTIRDQRLILNYFSFVSLVHDVVLHALTHRLQPVPDRCKVRSKPLINIKSEN